MTQVSKLWQKFLNKALLFCIGILIGAIILVSLNYICQSYHRAFVMPSSYEGIFMTQGFWAVLCSILPGIIFSMLLNVFTINLSNYGFF